ncbi:MAG: tetratricopeptide repeat protein [Proteobacteria bacterium]|nr:tetratricopeptide repeat protein [Pseudomonadota bacterium]MBU1687497.1 tetratricopeptide repeat protein [Pseudomonadota bacterium]
MQHYQTKEPGRAIPSQYSYDKIQDQLRHALDLLSKGKTGEALRLYRKILNSDPDNLHALFNAGIIHHSGEDLSQAVACYRKVLDQEPTNFQALHHMANALKDLGHTNEAIMTYTAALELDNAHADTHYNLAITLHQEGRFEEAAERYQKAIDSDQSHFPAHYNKGVLFYEMECFVEAAQCYRNGLTIQPDEPDCLYNLGLTLTKLGHLAEAVNCHELCIRLNPDDPELHNTLGSLYKQQTRLEEAEACYRKAISLRPDYGIAHTNLAIVLHTLDRTEEAILSYQNAIDHGHDQESAKYMLSALKGESRTSAPQLYITKLFDNYAENFEQTLTEKLGYEVPRLLKELFDDLVPPEVKLGHGIDLGCGTGLAGLHFKERVSRFTGVDLSGGMIKKAEEKKIYDSLHRADITEHLNSSPECFDLFIATDVFIYLGEIRPLFTAIAKRASDHALMLFSVELGEGNADYTLQKSGRYCYSPDYLQRLARDTGFKVLALREARLRKEKGEWLRGLLIAMGKTPGPTGSDQL